MITFQKLGNYGRLGNQLFQYAALKSLSLRKNYQLVLPNNEFNRLTNFQLRVHYAPVSSIPVQNIYCESNFSYDESFFNSKDHTSFEGYFQSEKYFKDISYIIKREFILNNKDITNQCLNTINKIKQKHPNQKISGMHIRRGDNVPADSNFATADGAQFKINKEDYHPLLEKKYIDYCLNEFQNDVKLVFSDSQKDIEWCKQNLKGENLYFIGGNSDLFDFEIMQYCDNLSISNSSFSWWSAWLNKNKHKRIIAPYKWFGKAYSQHDLKDLFPKEWEIYK
jgi:hypothetical protein